MTRLQQRAYDLQARANYRRLSAETMFEAGQFELYSRRRRSAFMLLRKARVARQKLRKSV